MIVEFQTLSYYQASSMKCLIHFVCNVCSLVLYIADSVFTYLSLFHTLLCIVKTLVPFLLLTMQFKTLCK